MRVIVLMDVDQSIIDKWRPSSEEGKSDEIVIRYALGMLLFEESVEIVSVSKEAEG